MICEVVVDVINRAVNNIFDYHVPHYLEDVVEMGCRVKINFNGGTRLGFVIKTKGTSSFKQLKEIEDVLDIIPCLNEELINLADKMRNNYLSYYITCLQTMVPAALRADYKKRIIVKEYDNLPLDLQKIFQENNSLELNKSLNEYMKAIKKEVLKNNLEIITDIKDSASVKIMKRYFLKEDRIVKSEKQRQIIDYLNKNQFITKEELNKFGFSISAVETLLKNGIIGFDEIERYREIESLYELDKKSISFNAEQEEAYQEIKREYNNAKTILLKGITGSGKTEIYISVISDILKKRKRAILLVPEISLTPQIVSRFKGAFGNLVAVLHSGLSIGERYDEWRRILKEEVSIVVGARSAIFAPIKNLGIIIIDEAHESTYKQDVDPKYDAISIAKIRSLNHNCPLILGSATPSVEQYYYALNGLYKLVTINSRAFNLPLPKVEVVNMTEELKSGNRGIFSNKLLASIKDRLNKKEQIMLLMNRRGHSSFVMCRECGHVVMCPNCEVSLTYHLESDNLKCHHCGYIQKNLETCPKCNSKYIKYIGTGTEKVEEEVKRIFPNAKVLRMDSDTIKNKGMYEKILYEFKEQNADILIGTQMIAKGLDFKNVSLVGVVVADATLKFPSFRAPFETFSLIEQVSGRAGRHINNGLVVIQAYNDDHYAIVTAKNHDYELFYKTEIPYRKIAKNPPFYRVYEISIKGDNEKETMLEAIKIKNMILLKRLNDIVILGPSEALIKKINKKYHFMITVKFINSKQIIEVLSALKGIYEQHKEFNVSINNF